MAFNMQCGEYVVCRNDRECFDRAKQTTPLLAMRTMPEGTPFANNAREYIILSRLSTGLRLSCIPAARCQFQAIRAELDRCHPVSVAL